VIKKNGVISFFAYTTGIILGYFLEIDTTIFFRIFIIITCISIFSLLFRRNVIRILIPITIFLFSIIYTDIYMRKELPENHIGNYADGQKHSVLGYLAKPVENRFDKYRIYLDTLFIKDNNKLYKVTGKIRINVPVKDIGESRLDLHYGDEISLKAKLYRPTNFRNPGGIDYIKYLKRQKIFALGYCHSIEDIYKTDKCHGNKVLGFLYGLRENILDSCRQDMEHISFQIFAAMVFGDRSYLTPSVKDKFSNLGIAHVISVSGLHVGFVALLFYAMFREFMIIIGYTNRYKHTGRICSLLTIFPVIAYSIISGMRIPTTRAMIMILIYLLGKSLYRGKNTLKSLAAAWVIILLIDPVSIADAGFQLSFLAVATILYANQYFISIQLEDRFPSINRKFIQYTVVVIFVYLTCIPVTLYHFNEISLLGMLGNLLIVPVLGVIISTGIISGIFIVIKIPIYYILNLIISKSLIYIFTIMDMTSKLPFCKVKFPLNTIAPILFYYLFLFSVIYFKGRKRILITTSTFIILSISLILNTSIFRGDKLRITYLDMGGSTSIHASFPNGKDYLIDCGGIWGINTGEFVIDPYLHHMGVNKLDKVIASHTHYDHTGCLFHILLNYRIKELLLGTKLIENPINKSIKSLLLKRKIKYSIEDYTEDEVGKFASLNNRSYIFKLIYGDRSILFPGDADNLALYSLLRYGEELRSNVLLLPHEGSANSSPIEFLEMVSPEIVVISVEKDNYFGHPSREVIKRLRSLEAKPEIYMTGRDGAIIITTDGRTLSIKTWETRWK